MKNKNILKTVAIALTILPVGAFALPVVHNTGVDSSDTLVAAGQATSFWELYDQPSGGTAGTNPYRYHNPAYFADAADAAWVSPGSNGNAGLGGYYTYRLAVDLTGFDLATVAIAGTFGTDNDGAIWLNGEAPVATTAFGGFGSQTAFSITDGFLAGLNYIYVTMNNGGDPTAFYVRFSETAGEPGNGGPPTGVPAPGTLALLALGLIGLGLRRRRRA